MWASSVRTLDSSHQFCLSVPRSGEGCVRDLAQVWQGSLWEGLQADPSLLLGELPRPSLGALQVGGPGIKWEGGAQVFTGASH